jgi:hypothetical protein
VSNTGTCRTAGAGAQARRLCHHHFHDFFDFLKRLAGVLDRNSFNIIYLLNDL